ncbi:MAG: SufD family Fe-S cluster assembly protein [Candidatus Gracilibacteria bacterium]|nr:SufD family Fe-S cluster assembly protein [Candidatus Gracilibacteria bacterium]
MKLKKPEGEKTILLEENQTLDLFLEDLEPGSRAFQLKVELRGANASCTISGRIHTSKADQKSWTIVQKFLGKNQTGAIEIRGVAEDKSQLELNATGILDKKSEAADAQISEKVLLFDEARAKALPVLTVKTDRVKAASHAASVAPVKAENLLFLTSRGIAPTEARKMLKDGFLAE